METLNKISKTLDVVNKVLTAFGWLTVVVFYGELVWVVFDAKRKKVSEKIEQESDDA